MRILCAIDGDPPEAAEVTGDPNPNDSMPISARPAIAPRPSVPPRLGEPVMPVEPRLENVRDGTGGKSDGWDIAPGGPA